MSLYINAKWLITFISNGIISRLTVPAMTKAVARRVNGYIARPPKGFFMTSRPDDTATTLIKVLSAASFGLGSAEVLVPRRLAVLCGLDDSRYATGIIRGFGLRECASGAALIAGPPKLVWTRVAGDALDLGLLLAALKGRHGRRRRRCTTAAITIAGITALDVYTALQT
jgi:hypothetical protein